MSDIPIIPNPHKMTIPLHGDPVDGILQVLGKQKGGSRRRSSQKRKPSTSQRRRSKHINPKQTLKQRLQRRLFV